MISIGHLKNFAQPKQVVSRFILLWSLAIPLSSAFASQSLDEIQRSARDYLQQKMIIRGINPDDVSIEVMYPDRRLNLAQCQLPLEQFQPINAKLQGHTTVGVKCSQPRWQIYLPAKVIRFSSVWVYTSNYQKGDSISANELVMEKRAVNGRQKPLLLSVENFSGLRATRSLREGQIVSSRDLCLICKGDQIKLVAKTSLLTVQMTGTSLTNGIKGQPITVRNNNSRKLVTGTVTTVGMLEIAL